jgi:hypothetical protein
VDILRLVMSYSSSLNFRLRLGSACEKNKLSSGAEPGLFQAKLSTNQCIAGAEVML